MTEHRTHLLIWHPTDRAFLTVDGALPVYESASDWAEPAFDIATRPLLKPDVPGGRDVSPMEHLLVLETLALPATLPTGARWATHANDLPGFPGIVQRVRELLVETVPETRPPWARRGWLAEVEPWIDRHLTRTGPIHTVKTWCLSCVLKIPTADGQVYFKVSNDRPLFANEATVTQALARLFPGRIPAPIALDPERGWLLLPDVGQPIGFENAPANLFTDFAQLQAESVDHLDALLAAGCLDRRSPVLDAQIQALLAADDGVEGLTEAERDALRTAMPELRNRIARVEADPLPDTVVHGDLHAGNVSRGPADSFVYFDWTDACIGPPTHDLLLYHWEKDEAKRAALLEAYFPIWESRLPQIDRAALWRDARLVLYLHHAVSYWYIERAREPYSWREMAGARAMFLRAALEALDAG